MSTKREELKKIKEEAKIKSERNVSNYQRNKESIKASVKAWRTANPEKYKAFRVEWCAKNKARLSAYTARWRAENPDKAKSGVDKWRAEHKDEYQAGQRAYYHQHKAEQKIVRQNRASAKLFAKHILNNSFIEQAKLTSCTDCQAILEAAVQICAKKRYQTDLVEQLIAKTGKTREKIFEWFDENKALYIKILKAEKEV